MPNLIKPKAVVEPATPPTKAAPAKTCQREYIVVRERLLSTDLTEPSIEGFFGCLAHHHFLLDLNDFVVIRKKMVRKGKDKSNSGKYLSLLLVIGIVVTIIFLHRAGFQSSDSKFLLRSTNAIDNVCWSNPSSFHHLECGGSGRNEMKHFNMSGICQQHKSLLNSSLIHSCKCGSQLDAGDCVEENSVVRCLPSFLIIGAMKSGTGALLRWLGMHPSIQVITELISWA